MTPALWETIGRLFNDVAECDEAEREARLAAAEPGVRAEVRALLAAERAAGASFASPDPLGRVLADALSFAGGDSGAGSEARPADPLPGTRVGPWAVEAEIGRGGMGTVYRARRADGAFEQTVALKVVRRGMDSDAVVERFLRERRVLAGLDHPHIARLVDGGTVPDGRPYFALELVLGEPITAYADRRALSVEARLALFVQACEAVAYAHRHLVVHRDLKPSNVLVADDEAGQPHVKLLDFGIARLLDGGADADALTADGARPLTPEYAAPEQLTGEPVTTAADVYALGVLLYELLAGQRPYDARTGGPGESRRAGIERAVRAGEPGRPSTSVTRPPATRLALAHSASARSEPVAPGEVARLRATTPERLSRRLRGDLDAVTLRALRRDPVRRYASADAFAADIRRHLAGHPVEARRGTRRYHVATFVRRHRWAVGGSTALVVLLIAFAAVLAVQNRRVARERDRVSATTAFLRDLLGQANALQTGRGDVTVAEVLGAAARRVPREFAGEAEAEATLLLTIGESYVGLSKYREAEPVLRRALALRRQLGQGDHAETVSALRLLALVVSERGSLDSAATLQREALAMARRVHGPRSLPVAHLLGRLGWTEKERARYDASERLVRAAVRMADGLAAPAAPGARPDSAAALEAASARGVLAVLLLRRGDYAEAERLDRAVLATRERWLGPRHPQTALSLSNLAKNLDDGGGSAAEALALTDRALGIRRAVSGDSSVAVLTTRSNRSAVLRRLGRHGEAVAEGERAYTTARALFGESHTATTYARYTLACALDAAGRTDEAAAHYAGALAQHEAIWGREHPYTAYVLVPYARLLLARGEAARALALARPAADARRRALGPDAPLLADADAALGLALAALGRADEARPPLARAYPVLVASRGASDRSAREVAAALARLPR